MVLAHLSTQLRSCVATYGGGGVAAARGDCWQHLFGFITIWLGQPCSQPLNALLIFLAGMSVTMQQTSLLQHECCRAADIPTAPVCRPLETAMPGNSESVPSAETSTHSISGSMVSALVTRTIVAQRAWQTEPARGVPQFKLCLQTQHGSSSQMLHREGHTSRLKCA